MILPLSAKIIDKSQNRFGMIQNRNIRSMSINYGTACEPPLILMVREQAELSQGFRALGLVKFLARDNHLCDALNTDTKITVISWETRVVAPSPST